MKQFGQLLLAAVMGSALTFTAYKFSGSEEKSGVKIEHISGTPTSSVAYTVNGNGQLEPLDFTETAAKVTAAVVHIRSTTEGRAAQNEQAPSDDPMQFFFGPRQFDRGPQQSSGSGVIVNENGYIVTNNHVVQDADVLDVTLSDDRTYKGEVIGVDPDTDIAVIKISEKGLPHLSFVNSDESKVGEWVLAVGNPFNLNSTVTAGIISAKGRNIGIINSGRDRSSNNYGTAIESFIQTDAAINPGNSGGALVNLSGGLLGINTAIASNTGSYAGYGFAVPANIVSKVVSDLIAYGAVQRGWLGIQVQSVGNELVKEHDLSVSAGAYVNGFGDFEDRSAAKAAGIKNGDVVVKLDDYAIRSSTALIEYIGTKHPGDKINVTVNRQGKTLVIPVTLKTREGNVGLVKREEVSAANSLGMQLEDVDQGNLKKLHLESGVRVKGLDNGKIARFTDMKKGFIITHVDDSVVKSSTEVNNILKKKKTGDLITISGVYEGYTREFIYAVRI